MVYLPGLKGQAIKLRRRTMGSEKKLQIISVRKPAFMSWTIGRMLQGLVRHPLLVILTFGLLLSMEVEYNLPMVKAGEEPVDLGFVVTAPVFRFMKQRPTLHNILAAANTVFVFFQIGYILSTFVFEGRRRTCIAGVLLYTSRGILGSITQLPIPKEFLGSGVDFPVGDSSFFLFFSGHVAGSVLASLDMRRFQRWRIAAVVDTLNVFQCIRLLGTRGHYTIDLIVGAVAGWMCDFLAGQYEESKKHDKSKEYELLYGNEAFRVVEG